MCGIVGFITKETKQGEAERAKFMRQGLIIDTLRGDDSTGAFAVGHEPLFKDGTAYWSKQVGPGHEFVDSKEYWENLYDTKSYRAVVGHNRAATVGGVTADTAHPFQEGPITLVHNGTLRATHMLPETMHSLGVTVDSHAICHNLAVHPVEDVIASLNGAFALVWHDARDDSVNVIRNSDRPLHFAMGQDGNSLFFMSEGGMLHMLGERLRLGLRSIYYPKEGQWLRWGPETPLGSPEVKMLDLYEDQWSVIGGYNSRYGQTHNGYSHGNWNWEDDSWKDNLSGKASAHSEEDQYILLGGRKREVPLIVQETLLKYDVVTEDLLRFTPETRSPSLRDKECCSVSGRLEGKHNAIIYSMNAGTAKRCDVRDWTVRVIGVKMGHDGCPWFICRLDSTYINLSNLSANPWGVQTKEVKTSGYNKERVPGPDGSMLTLPEWRNAVSVGCSVCGGFISYADAWDIVWRGDKPVCGCCDDDLTLLKEVDNESIIY